MALYNLAIRLSFEKILAGKEFSSHILSIHEGNAYIYITVLFTYAPINVMPEGGCRAWGGDFDILKKKVQFPHLQAKYCCQNAWPLGEYMIVIHQRSGGCCMKILIQLIKS